jgi:hypothetical protein
MGFVCVVMVMTCHGSIIPSRLGSAWKPVAKRRVLPTQFSWATAAVASHIINPKTIQPRRMDIL